MIASMTGFARRELTGTFGTLTCELRSVNHRYLEPGFRLPEELRPLESELRQQLSKHLKRGKVDCTVHLRSGGDPSLQVLVEGKVAPGSTVLIDGREIPVNARGHYSVTISIKPGQKQIEVIAIAPDGKKAVTVKELGK